MYGLSSVSNHIFWQNKKNVSKIWNFLKKNLKPKNIYPRFLNPKNFVLPFLQKIPLNLLHCDISQYTCFICGHILGLAFLHLCWTYGGGSLMPFTYTHSFCSCHFLLLFMTHWIEVSITRKV